MVGVASAFALVQTWLKDLPDYKSKNAFEVAQATKIYSADGKLLARLYLENREVVPISVIATSLTDGMVSIEDERFYSHSGVDPIGLVRAVVKTASGNRQGASTITQQYVRNTLLLDERTQMTATRKVREAYLALELEKRYNKTQILEMYLNTVYFGEGAYGAEAAAQTYFARPAKDLTLAQGALLAGLVQSPSRLDPYDNPEGAVARRGEVLGRMLYNDKITPAQYEQAKAEPLALMRTKEPKDGVYMAPYFVAHVKKALQQQFTPATVFKGGLTVHTTLDTRLQGYAESAAKGAFKKSGDPEVALVSIDPRTGYVKALVGGRDYAKRKFNLATQGYRQPGSSFKTFVLASAIDAGHAPLVPGRFIFACRDSCQTEAMGGGQQRGFGRRNDVARERYARLREHGLRARGVRDRYQECRKDGQTNGHPDPVAELPVDRARRRQRDSPGDGVGLWDAGDRRDPLPHDRHHEGRRP